jgi:hypothetical protein
MNLVNELMDFFNRKRAMVVNHNPDELKKDVDVIKNQYGPWCKVSGYSSFNDLFMALHLANYQKCPISMVFIQTEGLGAEKRVLEKTAPDIKTYIYTNTQMLESMLPLL